LDSDRLRQDLRNVVVDVEHVLKSMTEATGERAGEMKSQARQRLHEARERLANIQQESAARIRAAGQRTDDLVQQHPWLAIGSVSAVAFLLGKWSSRTRH